MFGLHFYFLSLFYFLELSNCADKEVETDSGPPLLVIAPKTENTEDHQPISYSSRTPNVGSELFCDTRGKHCWSPDDQLLLDSRRIFQDLIPIKMLDVTNGAFAETLTDYLRMCLDSISTEGNAKIRYTLRLAMMDTLGGYLRMYALPITKQAYYAGKVSYELTAGLFAIFDEFKATLRTDGQCWSPPVQLSSAYFNAEPIKITYTDIEENPCNEFIIEGWDRSSSKQNGNEETGEKKCFQSSALALPFFDSFNKPSAFSVPFKENKLRNIHCRDSASVLPRYYTKALGCFQYMHLSEKEIKKFIRRFHKWLCQQVFPLLFEEEWYPAFNGVYQILAQMQKYQLGASENNYGCLLRQLPNKKPLIVTDESKIEEGPPAPEDDQTCDSCDQLLDEAPEVFTPDDVPTATYIGVAIAVILGIWAMVGCLLFLTRRLSKSATKTHPCPKLDQSFGFNLFSRKKKVCKKRGPKKKKSMRRKMNTSLEDNDEDNSVISVYRLDESDVVSKDLGFSSDTGSSSSASEIIWSSDHEDRKGRRLK